MEMRQFPQRDFSSLFVSALSLAMAAWVVPTTHAQIDREGLNGTVTDTSGKALSAVQITALQTATGLHRETLTSSTGTYDIPELADAPVAGLSTGAGRYHRGDRIYIDGVGVIGSGPTAATILAEVQFLRLKGHARSC
jgi:hypothetical protein